MAVEPQNDPAFRLRIDDYILDLQLRGLFKGEQRIHLTVKPLETLIFLIENRGRVVSKQELMDAVWKETFVTEDNLVQAIRAIRVALEDDKDNPRFVQTVPRQGYRFIGDAQPESTVSAPANDAPGQSENQTLARITRRQTWLWVSAIATVLVLISLAVYSVRDKPQVNEGLRTNALKQITSGEFFSSKPSFSPDGRFIVYVSSSEETRGFGDLFVRQLPDGTPLRITDKMNPSGDLPVFTADGRSVVLSLPRIDKDDKRHHDLWIVPSFGGTPSRFLQDASGAGFSPDGKWVAYTKLTDSGSALWLSPVRNHDEHLEISTVGFTPRWSHNGDWVAYSTADPNDGHGDIWICRISESYGLPVVSDKKQLTNRDESIYGLTWDGSNSAVIFASRLAGSQQLYRVKVADGSLSPVISGVGEYGAPSICGDGSSLVFHHYRLVNDLMLAQLGESGVAQNISYSDDHRYPRIAPSNDKLISILRGADDADHLFLTDLKTKHSTQLTHRLARHPSWLDQQNAVFLSPDGTHNNTEVILVNTITQETRTLTSFEGTADWLAVHPDGKRLIVVLKSEGKERIVLRDLTSSIDQIVQEGSEYEYLRWSPDGSSICWDRPGVSRNAPHMSGGIWLLNIGETEPRQIARDGYCPVWSTDGGAIFYVLRQTPKGLRRYDIATQQDRKICDWDTVFSFDIRGDRIVFAQHRNDSQIYSVSLRL